MSAAMFMKSRKSESLFNKMMRISWRSQVLSQRVQIRRSVARLLFR
jgi:hypothetical protein